MWGWYNIAFCILNLFFGCLGCVCLCAGFWCFCWVLGSVCCALVCCDCGCWLIVVLGFDFRCGKVCFGRGLGLGCDFGFVLDALDCDFGELVVLFGVVAVVAVGFGAC